ncbi:MAG: hypothetical protein QXN08_08965 [Nitrososphaerales archaeon]
MSSQIAVIKNKINNLLKEKGVVKTIPTPTTPETPEPAFTTLVEIYKKDEDAKAAVDFYAQAIVGQGFHTTCAEGYEEAKRAVDQFAESVGLDIYLLEVAKEIVAYGNSFTELISPSNLKDLKILPIGCTWQIYRSLDGNVLKIEQHKPPNKVEFRPEEIIHWRWSPVNGEAFGRGLLHSLSETLTYTLKFSDGSSTTRVVPSLYKIKAMLRDDLRKLLHHYIPKSAWVFIDASDSWIQTQANLIGKLDAGERIAVNKDVKIVEETLDLRGKLDFILQYFENAYIKALQTPIIKLFTTPGYTEASARVVQEQFERLIRSLQRYIKRVVERKIFSLIVMQEGYDPVAASVRLNWGQVEPPKVEFEHLLRAGELGFIRVDEVRRILAKIGFQLTEEAQSK